MQARKASAVVTGVVLVVAVAGVAAALAQATVPGKNGQIVYRHFKSLFVVNSDGTGERKLTNPGSKTGTQTGPPTARGSHSIAAHRRAAFGP